MGGPVRWGGRVPAGEPGRRRIVSVWEVFCQGLPTPHLTSAGPVGARGPSGAGAARAATERRIRVERTGWRRPQTNYARAARWPVVAALPPGLALELIDGLAVGLAAGSCEVSRLVRLQPGVRRAGAAGRGPRRRRGASSARPGRGHDRGRTWPGPSWPWPCADRAAGARPGPGGEVAAVYCLGVLLYHMLSGRAPVRGARPRRPGHVAPEGGAATAGERARLTGDRGLLWRALARRPEARFQAVAGFRQAVESVRQAPEAVAPPAGGTGTGALAGGGRPVLPGDQPLYPPPRARRRRAGRCPRDPLGRGGPGRGRGPAGRPRRAALRLAPGPPAGHPALRAGGLVGRGVDGHRLPPAKAGAPPRRASTGVALAPGERRPVSVGDAIAFGPVRMLLSSTPPARPRVAGPGGRLRTRPRPAARRARREGRADRAQVPRGRSARPLRGAPSHAGGHRAACGRRAAPCSARLPGRSSPSTGLRSCSAACTPAPFPTRT